MGFNYGSHLVIQAGLGSGEAPAHRQARPIVGQRRFLPHGSAYQGWYTTGYFPQEAD